MAWFDRNPGGKKGPESEPEKVPEVAKAPDPTPVAPPPEPKPAPKVEAPVPPTSESLVGHLYKGSRINGQLTFQGAARIDGNVEGEVQCQGTLTIGESAEVRAKIAGQVVVIRGRVEGNVTATEKIELVAPARLFGNIQAPRLVISEGVVFDGDCSMGAPKQQKVGVANSQGVNVDKATGQQAPKRQGESDK